MSWDSKRDILIVRRGHPEGNPPILKEGKRCEVKDIIQHGFEAVRSLGRNILRAPVQTCEIIRGMRV